MVKKANFKFQKLRANGTSNRAKCIHYAFLKTT